MKLHEVQPFIEEKTAAGVNALTEIDAKRIFKAFDIPVVEEKLGFSPEEAGKKAIETGFPVVLKGMGSSILHKTESGLVCVGLSSKEQVEEAAGKMQKTSGHLIDVFLVQPQIEGNREFVAGMFRDPQFGPVILFGLGGVFTEALQDTVIKIAPLKNADMDDMFDQMTSKKLLGAFRGEKAVDRQALKSILKGLSTLALQFPQIREIDINPLIIQPDGSPLAVDGLIVLEEDKTAASVPVHIDKEAMRSCYYPQSIAFIGASSGIGKWGNMLVANTLSMDFKGKVYLVNPKGGKIFGKDVYKSINDIKDRIDLAVVTIPADRVIDLLPDLAKKNTKAVLLITSGFRETGEAGARLEETLVKEAKKARILIFGPNTMGICNPHANFFCTAAHVYPLPGSTALVCQSGNMGTQLLAFAEQQDIGIRAFSGSGNEAMVTIEDYMEIFETDDLTRTVVLYIESIKQGSRFFKSACRVSRKKPVVVLKGGRTQLGEQAASSHTGAMASDAKVFDAACRQTGIIQVEQPMELLDLSAVFSSLPLPKGKRVAIMTLGGGWGVIATDLCSEYGFEVPELSEDIIKKLNTILPPFWSHGNPVDIVGERDPSIPKTCMAELLKWGGCDAVIHLGIHGRKILGEKMAASILKTDPAVTPDQIQYLNDVMSDVESDYIEQIITLTETYEKPIIGVSLLTDEKSRTLYRSKSDTYKGVFFPSPERAVKALSGMVQYHHWLKENQSDVS